MKKIIIMSFLAATLLITAKAQIYSHTYTQGNITAVVASNPAHDSTLCRSWAHMNMSVTKQNSFTGDSVIVKHVYSNSAVLLFTEVNTTGQNPWVFSDTLPMDLAYDVELPDDGITHFNGGIYKVISGTDTIYDVADTCQYTVPNACPVSKVSGRVYADYNGNCVFDSNDVPLMGIQMGTQQDYQYPHEIGGISRSGYTDVNGMYIFNEQLSYSQDYSLYLSPEYQFVFNGLSCSPMHYASLPDSTLPTQIDFALQCSVNDDVQCFATSPPAVRPLVPFPVFAMVSNIGCNNEAGTLKLVLDPRVTYNSSQGNNQPTVSGDTLIWHYYNLSNLANGGAWNQFFYEASLTPNNNVNIGDSLCFTVIATIPVSDIDPTNNSYSFCIPVVNSFDPNLKEVSPRGYGPQGYISPSTDSLIYTIHFQNTGNATAFNLRVVDTLDSNIEPGSLQIMGTSKNLSPGWISNNVISFGFFGINLPDSGSNQAGSNAAFSFKVRLKPSLPEGTEIKNTAYIYFDNNAPIKTNTALNTIKISAGIEQLNLNTSIEIFPNPATNRATIRLGSAVNNYSLKIINLSGQTVLTRNNLSDKEYTFDITNLNNGLYFVEINSNGIFQRTKFIKAF